MFGRIHYEAIWSWVFFVGTLFITDSISSLLVCLGFLFLRDSVLVGCILLGIYPYFLSYSVCWHVISHHSCMTLCISVVSAVMFLLMFLIFIYLNPLFFLVSLASCQFYLKKFFLFICNLKHLFNFTFFHLPVTIW